MANVRNGNTWFLDSTGGLTEGPNDKVTGIIVSGNGGHGHVILADNLAPASYPKKIHIIAPSNDTVTLLNISILFPNGVYVDTITNASVTLIMSQGGG